MNVVTRLEFELADYDTTVKYKEELEIRDRIKTIQTAKYPEES